MPSAVDCSAGSSPGRVALVANGRAKQVTQEVVQRLRSMAADADVFLSHSLQEADEIAEKIARRRYDTVLVGGGDGTFSVMVTKVLRAFDAEDLADRPRFGYLKLGTGNALAHVVGSSPHGLERDYAAIMAGAPSRPLHMVEVEDSLSLFCGLGLDTAILARFHRERERAARSWRRPFTTGLVGYALSSAGAVVQRLSSSQDPHFRILNEGPGSVAVEGGGRRALEPGELLFEGSALLVGLSTIPFYGYGLKMFPELQAHPSGMQLRVADLSISDLLAHAQGLWAGTYRDPRRIRDFLVTDVRLEIEPEAELQVGGDLQGPRSKLRVRRSAVPVELIQLAEPSARSLSAF